VPIADTLLPELDQEMGRTRRLLERVPEDKLSWKPHEKSMTLGRLAGHIAELPGWIVTTIEQTGLDLAAFEGFTGNVASSRTSLLALFDQNVAAARRALAGRTDAELEAPWTLRHGSHEIFTQPRAGVLRSMGFNHLVHHRGQLSVYLRLLDVAVPSIYGPSADER